MADNVTFQSDALATPPAGTKVSADDASDSSGLLQRVKLAYSADGSAVHVPADADGLLVNLGTNNDVTVTGTVTANAGSGTMAVSLASLPALAAGTNGIGKLTANNGVDIGDVDVTSTVQPTANTTAVVTSVSDTVSSTTLLSSSGARKGFRITNTSSAVLYVKYGTTASASDFTVRLPQWAYLEENFFSGRVDGIWASDPGDGAALITSLSA